MTAGKAFSRSTFGSLQEFLEGRVPFETFASALHGHHCGMDPKFFAVWKRVVESKFILGLTIETIFIRVRKTLARLVSLCARIPWTIRRQPNLCSVEKKQRADQALSALLASQPWSAARIRRRL